MCDVGFQVDFDHLFAIRVVVDGENLIGLLVHEWKFDQFLLLNNFVGLLPVLVGAVVLTLHGLIFAIIIDNLGHALAFLGHLLLNLLILSLHNLMDHLMRNGQIGPAVISSLQVVDRGVDARSELLEAVLSF